MFLNSCKIFQGIDGGYKVCQKLVGTVIIIPKPHLLFTQPPLGPYIFHNKHFSLRPVVWIAMKFGMKLNLLSDNNFV